MTPKDQFSLKMAPEKFARMKKVMERERLTNKTAFIINAIDAACDKQDHISDTARLEKLVNMLAESARIDREESEKRHNELMAWVDVLAQAVCGGDQKEYNSFIQSVETVKRKRRGTTQ